MTISDGRGFGPDRIHLSRGPRSACGRPDESWTSADKHRVSVTIELPRETR